MKTQRATYTAVAMRSGNWWAIEVPEVRGVFSQARRLDQVEQMARDAISLMLQIPSKSFDVDVVPTAPQSMRGLLEEYRNQRDVAEKSQSRAADLAQEIIAMSDAEDLTVRDVGELMGLSFQRVQQLRSHRRATEVRGSRARGKASTAVAGSVFAAGVARTARSLGKQVK